MPKNSHSALGCLTVHIKYCAPIYISDVITTAMAGFAVEAMMGISLPVAFKRSARWLITGIAPIIARELDKYIIEKTAFTKLT